MSKWEYTTAVLKKKAFGGFAKKTEKFEAELKSLLNAFGSDGWELIWFVGDGQSLGSGEITAVFKREISE